MSPEVLACRTPFCPQWQAATEEAGGQGALAHITEALLCVGLQGALAFSIKRGGILYGRVDEAKNVLVEAVYEPPQEGSASHLTLHRQGLEAQQVRRETDDWGGGRPGGNHML